MPLIGAAAAVGSARRTQRQNTQRQNSTNKLKAASTGLLGKDPESSTFEEAFDTLRSKVMTVATGVRLRAKKGATAATDSLQALRKSGSQLLRQNESSETEAAIQHLMGMGFSREDAEEMSAADAMATAQLNETRETSTSAGNIVQAQVKSSFRNVQATVNKTKARVETIIGKPAVDSSSQHAAMPREASDEPPVAMAREASDERPVEIDAKRRTVYEATERRLVEVQARTGGTMDDWRRQRLENQKAHAFNNMSSAVGAADQERGESQRIQLPESATRQVPAAALNAEQGVWLGADKIIVSKDELEMQRAIAVSLGVECAEPAALVAASSASSSSSSSSSAASSSGGSSHSTSTVKSDFADQLATSCAPDGEVLAPVQDAAPKDFKRLPSVASWLVPLPFDCGDSSAQQDVLPC